MPSLADMRTKAKDEKDVEENYPKNIEALKWHLIKEKLVEQNEIKVEDADVVETAKELARMQFAQYGMLDIPEEYIESSANEMLKKRENLDNLIDRCIDDKLIQTAKQIVTLDTKDVTSVEFAKL